ncbi:MAG: hypothetical protein HY903_00680 [Deltaproteobacteria bacterium]|nr:hypothetical protein [Deltaproteobacteria bacterium]
MRKLWACQVAIAVILFARPGAAVELTLQNDGWTSGAQAKCQGGFAVGEEAAVTFGPLAGTATLESIELLFCGATTSAMVGLRVLADDGTATPGAELYATGYQLTGADNAIQSLDLSALNLTFAAGARFRVAFEMQQTGLPSVAADTDGSIQTGKNWIATAGGWTDSKNLGLTGDWIIRAKVNIDLSSADGGPSPGDADTGCVAGEVCANEPKDGCACVQHTASAWAGLALVAFAAGRRRRR